MSSQREDADRAPAETPAASARDDLERSLDRAVGRLVHALGSGSPPGSRQPGGDEATEIARLAEEYLQRGRDLLHWWKARSDGGSFASRFELGRTFNEATESYGFFDTAEVGGESMPVMGNFQEMSYDRPKSAPQGSGAAAGWLRDQMREFVLRYFMRVSDFREPEGFAETWRPPLSTIFEMLSWCPEESEELRGFGFQQLVYKERGGGVHPFRHEERYRIVDLRDLLERYEWIVVKVRIFDFRVTVRPFGAGTPEISLPLQEASYLVLSRDFVEIEEEPEPGVLARYGFGYAFVRDPRPGMLGYGPGQFDAAIETIHFHVADDGSVRVPMVFVANRPERVATVEVDPWRWSVELGRRLGDLATLGLADRWIAPMARMMGAVPRPRLRFDPVLGYVRFADAVSGGMAASRLCIDREQLEKDFLVKHYMQHYQTIAGSLATWRLIGDWCDEASLPAWVVEGRRP